MEDPNVQTILVVDDSMHIRKIISKPLARIGYSMLEAADGEKAFEIIKNRKIDLVTLDIIMPGMDGLELLQKIRELYSKAELPVLVVTVSDSREVVQEAFQKGANAFLRKPFEFEELLDRVRQLL